jgi:hypothetical protein
LEKYNAERVIVVSQLKPELLEIDLLRENFLDALNLA